MFLVRAQYLAAPSRSTSTSTQAISYQLRRYQLPPCCRWSYAAVRVRSTRYCTRYCSGAEGADGVTTLQYALPSFSSCSARDAASRRPSLFRAIIFHSAPNSDAMKSAAERRAAMRGGSPFGTVYTMTSFAHQYLVGRDLGTFARKKSTYGLSSQPIVTLTFLFLTLFSLLTFGGTLEHTVLESQLSFWPRASRPSCTRPF